MRTSLCLLILAVSACAPEPPAVDDSPKSYEAVGTIVSVEGEYVLIDHDDIPGLMDAMTMTFSVSEPALLENLDRGSRVSFRVVVEGASYTIDRIEIKGGPH
jgi:protein SCO1/2